jgi:hypothetical protein
MVAQVGLVSSLAYAESAGADEPVAEIVLRAAGETTARLTVRAGKDTAEWSVDNPVRAMAHGPAAIERSWAMAGEGYQGHAYRASWSLPAPVQAEELEVRSLHPTAVLKVEALTFDGVDLLRQGQRYVRERRQGLYRNQYALARARLLRSWRVAPIEADTLRALEAVDLSREVVLEKPPVFPAPGDDLQPAADDQVRVVDEGLNRVELEVAARTPAILFLADTHYPGWKVMVDGRPAELLRANYCFRAVALGPGTHRVEFVFRPTRWALAWGVSLASLVLLVVLGLAGWLGGRRRRDVLA